MLESIEKEKSIPVKGSGEVLFNGQDLRGPEMEKEYSNRKKRSEDTEVRKLSRCQESSDSGPPGS